MMQQDGNLHRTYRRVRVRWQLQWNAFGRVLGGTVLDASATGVFVTARPEDLASLRPGCRVQLTIALPGRQRRVQSTGTVRWIGESFVHHCQGFGVELDTVAYAIGAYLYGDSPKLLKLERRTGTL